MSIWTEPSRYGTCNSDTKSVSTSTARRWAHENRTKTRRSQSMRKQVTIGLSQPVISTSEMKVWMRTILA